MDEVILAIDGGATKTAMTVQKRNGVVLFDGKGEGSNFQTVGADKVKEVLGSLLAEVRKVLPKMKVEIAVFALAGIDSKQDELVVRGIVEEVSRLHGLQASKLIIENDAEATMLGATGGKPGALLISGTGSIAYAHDAKGKIVRSGGWGHRAGDEGSGYWLGREVLRAIFRMEDGRGPETTLKREVLQELELDSVQALAGWLFASTYSVDNVASLSRVLSTCAEKGDGVAIGIMEEAADELALLVGAVLRKCELENVESDIYLNGGALINSEMLVNGLRNHVKTEFPLCQLITSTKSPIESIVARGWLELSG
ncbi:N-acetylglucosamine kinase [Sporosarcina sp. JAI121]|uniref:N-acetylglucosamine kinase n=1 Tax=Sporosarcina sp. JAI121 TaxID=2723064 RepID=UPI0015C6C10B|nr:BadF/BadG/BcrA/BcrD ATPase family protein [Sporosarcina sp. JAI121]NYF23809.1 N-acetylglucosamine kinase-like BadF-type ATPase [Sporosarcina sp. JAI121]